MHVLPFANAKLLKCHKLEMNVGFPTTPVAAARDAREHTVETFAPKCSVSAWVAHLWNPPEQVEHQVMFGPQGPTTPFKISDMP